MPVLAPSHQHCSGVVFGWPSVVLEQINRAILPETHAAALQAVFQIAHMASGQAFISKVAEIANRILLSNDERILINARKAGTILTSLGIAERTRTNRGSTLVLNSDLCQEIYDLVAGTASVFRRRHLSPHSVACAVCAKPSSALATAED